MNTPDEVALFRAARCGKLKRVWALIHRGVNVTAVNEDEERQAAPYEYKWTALHYAAFEGNVEIARALIEAGAHLEAKGSMGESTTPLHLACQMGYVATAFCLMNAGADIRATSDDTTTLAFACDAAYREEGVIRIVRRLIEEGVKPAAEEGAGAKLLLGACSSGHASLAEFLVSEGVTIPCELDSDSSCILHHCKSGEVVSFLLKAQPELYRLLDARDDDNWAPIHYATKWHEEESRGRNTALALLNAGATTRDDAGLPRPRFSFFPYSFSSTDEGVAHALSAFLADAVWSTGPLKPEDRRALGWASYSPAAGLKLAKEVAERRETGFEEIYASSRDMRLEDLREDAWQRRKHLVTCYVMTRRMRRAGAAAK